MAIERHQRGFSLLEAIVALTILATAGLALFAAMNPNFYDDEVVVRLECGASLRSGVLKAKDGNALTSGCYYRLCDQSGKTLLSWSEDEWNDEPDQLLGKIIDASSKLNSTSM